MTTNSRCSDGADNTEEDELCALCLDVFRSPKILPCYHTFCEQCLRNLVSHHPRTFQCPECRKPTNVPPGGVSKFQTNFYIKPRSKQTKPSNTGTATSIRNPCGAHPTKELEFFCVKCDQPICLNCKLTEHEQHETKDLSAYTAFAKGRLLKEGDRLKGQIECARKGADLADKELKAVKKKQRALRKLIEDRHSCMQFEIDRYRDNALAALDKVSEEILVVQEVEVYSRKEKVDKLTRLQDRVQRAADSGNFYEMWTAGTEVSGSGLEQDFLQKLTTQTGVVSRPVLYCTFAKPTDAELQPVRDYIGNTVIKTELPVVVPEVVLQELFRCPVIHYTDVCRLCPMTDGTVWVSFRSADKSGEKSEKFRGGGTLDTSESRVYGQTARMGIKGGKSLDVKPPAGTTFVFAKRRESHLTRFLGLRSNLAGQAIVEEIRVESVEPLVTTTGRKLCDIQCCSPRACDVDSSEQFLVVLEEGDRPDAQHTVTVYRPPQPDPITAYTPPGTPFQPSDVCFYKLGDQEVLLVADELNDAIHVVNVQNGQFAGFLAPGCPKLIKPTALNTDTRGRLWVACRGGSILRSQI